MPVYEYKCLKCGLNFDYFIRASSDSVSCPKCKGSKLKKLISAFSFCSKDAGGNITASSSGCSDCTSHNCSSCSR